MAAKRLSPLRLATSPPPDAEASSSSGGAPVAHSKTVSFQRPSLSYPRSSGDHDAMDEQSPLLQPRTSLEEENGLKVVSPLTDEDWEDDAGEKSKSSWYMLLLTICGLGLQISWSVELSNGSPYLLSLGISKSLLALVWIAGPLSGVLVQPYVGLKSDNSRSRWGKRRPFIIGGGIATIISLLALAWAKEIIGGFLSIFGANKEAHAVKNAIIGFAVLFVYILDFSLNVIQAAIRAFIVDCTPTHQQAAANAWIMRTTGAGNILGYLSGYVDLVQIFPFLGNTQFKILCVIACVMLGVTVSISCFSIEERDPRLEGEPKAQDGLLAFFKGLYHSVRRLPPQIMRVCQVQFFAWVGWFPFLFYITTYIGEIYVDPFFQENPNMSDEEIDKIWEKGTRVGTFALLIFAVTYFVASIFLPLIIAPTYQAPQVAASTPLTPTTPGSLSNSGYFNLKRPKSARNGIFTRVMNILSNLQIRSFTLRRLWFISHVLFIACMWSTFFVRSVTGATVLVAAVGIPWAISNWAPFSLIASEISKRDAIRRGLIRPPPTRDGQLLAAGEDDSADQAGVVLGIHNVAMSAPQIIATLVSSLIFRALQKPRGAPGDDSVVWVLRFGGCCTIIAAWLSLKISEDTAK